MLYYSIYCYITLYYITGRIAAWLPGCPVAWLPNLLDSHSRGTAFEV